MVRSFHSSVSPHAARDPICTPSLRACSPPVGRAHDRFVSPVPFLFVVRRNARRAVRDGARPPADAERGDVRGVWYPRARSVLGTNGGVHNASVHGSDLVARPGSRERRSDDGCGAPAELRSPALRRNSRLCAASKHFDAPTRIVIRPVPCCKNCVRHDTLQGLLFCAPRLTRHRCVRCRADKTTASSPVPVLRASRPREP